MALIVHYKDDQLGKDPPSFFTNQLKFVAFGFLHKTRAKGIFP